MHLISTASFSSFNQAKVENGAKEQPWKVQGREEEERRKEYILVFRLLSLFIYFYFNLLFVGVCFAIFEQKIELFYVAFAVLPVVLDITVNLPDETQVILKVIICFLYLIQIHGFSAGTISKCSHTY